MVPLWIGLAVGTTMIHQANFVLMNACPMVQKHMEWEDDFCTTDLSEIGTGTDGKVPLTPEELAPIRRQAALYTLTGVLVWGVIGACLFKKKVTDEKVKSKRMPDQADLIKPDLSLADGRPMKYGLFSCCEDTNYCLHAWCCYPCFTADLFAANAIHSSFWMVWLIVMIPAIVPSIVQAAMPLMVFDNRYSTPIQIFVAVFLALNTAKLREKLGGNPNNCEDVLKWWFCPCCTVIQWQRQVDEIKDDRVECFMSLKDTKGREIGDAFMALEA